MTESAHLSWFQQFRESTKYKSLSERPIAYFCAEYALEDKIRTYAGGLGILAGDVVREAADQKLPFVAVGMYYRRGYVCEIHAQASSSCDCESVVPESVGLEPVMDKGAPIIVTVPLYERDVKVRAWRWKREGVDAYLLDTDVEGNELGDRSISDRLYVGDKETRLEQEIIIGIGGLRLLERLGIHPSIYHLNEGHPAFLAFELIRHEMQERQIGFDEAKQFARRRIVLTNHTLVPAGFELFSNDLVGVVLERYARELQAPVSDLVKLGLVQQSSQFAMTMLALRMSSVVNAVSQLHARKAKEMWGDHPMVAVTNGVHVPTWDAYQGTTFGPGEFLPAHMEKKRALLAHIKERTGRDWKEDELLIGWARRIAGYKRPLAAIVEAERFAAIARAEGRPVRIVFAGKAHPDDKEGAEMLRKLQEVVDGPLKDVACYLPGYDVELGQTLTAGCDVWLNTPVVGYEACGTSGMKAALCGALPCSTKDGWMDEIDTLGIGWSLDSVRVTQSFLEILERDIVPMWYHQEGGGRSALWDQHMRNARAMARDRFSATRMLRGYVETLYT